MADRAELERLVGQLVMDEEFRNEFFSSVTSAEQGIRPGDNSPTQITTKYGAVELTAEQLKKAHAYKRKCMDEFKRCLDDLDDVNQEAW